MARCRESRLVTRKVMSRLMEVFVGWTCQLVVESRIQLVDVGCRFGLDTISNNMLLASPYSPPSPPKCSFPFRGCDHLPLPEPIARLQDGCEAVSQVELAHSLRTPYGFVSPPPLPESGTRRSSASVAHREDRSDRSDASTCRIPVPRFYNEACGRPSCQPV